jgi:hypothetical protein
MCWTVSTVFKTCLICIVGCHRQTVLTRNVCRSGIDGLSQGVTGSSKASLSLIPSLGAWTKSCFVPRYRSVV